MDHHNKNERWVKDVLCLPRAVDSFTSSHQKQKTPDQRVQTISCTPSPKTCERLMHEVPRLVGPKACTGNICIQNTKTAENLLPIAWALFLTALKKKRLTCSCLPATIDLRHFRSATSIPSEQRPPTKDQRAPTKDQRPPRISDLLPRISDLPSDQRAAFGGNQTRCRFLVSFSSLLTAQ